VNTTEQKIDILFAELVPTRGNADTVAGEIIRAVSRIAYRNWNDGDHVGVGYGKETCNPAARYLMRKAGADVAQAVSDTLLERVQEAVLEYIELNPELKTTKNAEDMFDYRDPDEDIDDAD